MSKKIAYRADVDGLRALAVLLVLLNHFEIPFFTGGFIGVDVFFVISGYLITSIILKGLKDKTFTLSNFYAKRVRRILPALLVVIISSILTGYFILLPGDLQSLGLQSAYAVFGLSNFYFLNNTGYFDQAAELLPLLHTWSLGVEEQFYGIWPLLIITIWHYSKKPMRNLKFSLLFIIISSFIAAQFFVSTRPDAAFYLPFTRAWELALGALIVFMPKISARVASLANLTGLALIGLPAIFLDASSTFPGVGALAPCLGAGLLVWPVQKKTFATNILSQEPLRQIGLASYSIYLWHWPLLVFYKHYNLARNPNEPATYLLIASSILLGFISLKYVESPFRKFRPDYSKVSLFGTAFSAVFVIFILGISINYLDGLPDRLNDNFKAMRSRAVMQAWSEDRTRSDIKGIGKVGVFGKKWELSEDRVFLWGDSHAVHFAPILNSALTKKQSAILDYSCPAILGGSYNRIHPKLPMYSEKCKKERARNLEFLSNTPDIKTVVLASLWQAYYLTRTIDGSPVKDRKLAFKEATEETVNTIRKPGRKIILVSNFPKFPFDPMGCVFAESGLLRAPCSIEKLFPRRDLHVEESPIVEEVFAQVANKMPDVEFVSPGDGLCRFDNCLNSINGEFLYRDPAHIRRNLSETTLRKLSETIGLHQVFSTEQ